MDRNCRLKREHFFSVAAIVFLGVIILYWIKPLNKDSTPKTQDGKSVNILLPPFDKDLDPTRITSASNYILISHLVRNLVKTDETLQIYGDLAQKWTIADDFTLYTFFLGSGHLFSDGSPITAQDFAHSISRQIKSKSAIHFDFSSIESVRASDNSLTIKLKAPSKNFLYKLTHPEFGVLHPSDYKSNAGATFNTTSGPYVLNKSTAQLIELVKNKHYSLESKAPESLIFHGKKEVGTIYDFILSTHSNKNFDIYINKKNYKLVRPHIGFTFWLNINKTRFTQDQSKFLQKTLSGTAHDYSALYPYWAPARQLYLPDGFGRLNDLELDKIWSEINADASSKSLPKSISVLLYEKFPMNEELIKTLKKIFATVNVDTYEHMNAFDRLSKEKQYDLKMINNDFASSDVTENILVALNKNRPLIDVPENHKIFDLLSYAESADDLDHKSKYLKEIELEVLSDALIIPLAYLHVTFYVHPNLDISSWSMLSPEISFWKAQWKD